MARDPVTAEAFDALEGVGDWRYLHGTIDAEFRAETFSAGAALVASIAEAADAANHHPDLALHYPGKVRVTLTSHDVGEVTVADVDLARKISALAADAGAPAEPSATQSVDVAIDTTDADRIRPFWAAVLGYKEERDGSLSDPAGIGPGFWFQDMDEPRTERNRFHIDVDVPHDQAESRIQATLAAGGTLVTDEFAPAWWVLADADGNEACICTSQGR